MPTLALKESKANKRGVSRFLVFPFSRFRFFHLDKYPFMLYNSDNSHLGETKMSDKVRVRFAPSPTGYLHVGSARTVLFNWLFAKHHDGTFILRIDDTDKARSTEASTRGIFESLRWLGLNWDEGPEVGGPYVPYVQSERTEIYREYVDKLLENGHAYYCYCTKKEIAEEKAKADAEKRQYRYDGKCRNLTEFDRARLSSEGRKPTIRFKVESGPIVVHDLILGDTEFNKVDPIFDFIIVTSDDSPLYIFTSPIDDCVMKITHVIRASEHLSNTPRQILILNALGVEPPQFAHVPLVLGSSKGEKLSKRRHGDLVAVERYEREGYLPEAMLNYLVRLGWSFDDTSEIFSIKEMIEKFDLNRVSKSGAVFDLQKLQWLNGQYIMKVSIPERTDAVIPFLKNAGLLDEDEITPERRAWLETVVEAVGERLKTLADIETHTSYLFVDDIEYDKKAVKKWFKKDYVPAMLQDLRTIFAHLEPFDEDTIEAKMREFGEQNELKLINVLQPLRVAITGISAGPGIFELLVLLGKERVLQRLDRTVEFLNNR